MKKTWTRKAWAHRTDDPKRPFAECNQIVPCPKLFKRKFESEKWARFLEDKPFGSKLRTVRVKVTVTVEEI